MQSKLVEFERNKVCRLFPKPDDVSIVRLKWVFKNKIDKEENIIRKNIG